MPRSRDDQKDGRAPNARDLARSSAAVYEAQNRRARGEEPEDPAGLVAEAHLYVGAGLTAAMDRLLVQLQGLTSHTERVADAAERIADHLEQEK